MLSLPERADQFGDQCQYDDRDQQWGEFDLFEKAELRIVVVGAQVTKPVHDSSSLFV